MNAGQMMRAGGMDAVRVRLLIAPIDPDEVTVRSAPKLMMRFWGQGIGAMTFAQWRSSSILRRWNKGSRSAW